MRRREVLMLSLVLLVISSITFYYLEHKIQSQSTGTPTTRARVAVCFSGQMRSLKSTIFKMRENLFQQLQILGEVDTFALVSDCPDLDEVREILKPVAADCKNAQKLAPIAMDPHTCHGDPLRYEKMAKHANGSIMAIDAPSAAMGLFEQLRGIEMCQKLVEDHQKLEGIRYKYVVRTRFDLLWQKPLDTEALFLDDTKLYLPDHQQWSGLNDKVAIGDLHAMSVYTNQLKHLRKLCSSQKRTGSEFLLQAEKWLLQHLSSSGVHFKPIEIAATILRSNGALSPT